MGTVLKTEAITMRFGGVTAVNELKLDIPSTVTYQTKIDINAPVYNNAEGGAY